MRKVIFVILGIFAIPVIYMLMPITYTYYISGPIKSSTYNTVMLWVIDNVADGNDTIEVRLNTPGGSAITSMRIVNSLLATKAKTVGVNEVMAASGGAVIFFACDEREFMINSVVMVHKPYYTVHGIKVVLPVDSGAHKLVHPYVKAYIFPHLTDGEQTAYNLGMDVWLSRGELMKRGVK